MRVFINYLARSRFESTSTDRSYPKDFAALADGQDLEIVFNESRLSALIIDWAIIFKNARRRWWFPNHLPLVRKILTFFTRNSLILPWQLRGVEVVLAYWYFPIQLVAKKRPIVLPSQFLSNEYEGVSSDLERMDEVKALRAWFSSATIVGFPARSWIDHFNSLEPRFKDKIVFLPFFLPNTTAIDKRKLVDKFNTSDKIRLIFVGRDGKRKGLDELIEALSILAQEHTNTVEQLSVTIVSETPHRSIPGIDIVTHKNLPNPQIIELMQASHIFCMPTKHDSYGLVFIEAMASGCAIIADDKPPRTEFFDNGNCGVLTDGSAQDVAEAIYCLTTNREYAAHLAKKALAKYQATYEDEWVRYQYLQHIFNAAKQKQNNK